MKDTKNYGPDCLGHVIRIIDDTEIIINVGNFYLTVGDKVIVYTTGDTIKDLDGTDLGVYEYDKATLNVITTTDNYSICKTDAIYQKASFGIIPPITDQEVFSGYKQISVNEKQISPIDLDNKNTVQIGDPVKKANW